MEYYDGYGVDGPSHSCRAVPGTHEQCVSSERNSSAFGLICLLSLLQGIAAIAGLYRINHLTRDLTERTEAAASQTSELRQQMQKQSNQGTTPPPQP